MGLGRFVLRWIVLCPLLAVVALPAFCQEPVHAKPRDAIFLEAESMTVDGQSWRVQEHVDGMYDRFPTGMRFLAGDRGGPGRAVGTVTLPSAGPYRLWVRYVDTWKATHPFTVTLRQGGRDVASRTFDEHWLRHAGTMQLRWGHYAYTFLWDGMEAELEVGPCEIVLSKAGANDGAWRYVDCLAITQDMDYVPSGHDYLPPLYMKGVMGGADNVVPVLLHIWGQVGHHDISKRGLRTEGHTVSFSVDVGHGDFVVIPLKP